MKNSNEIFNCWLSDLYNPQEQHLEIQRPHIESTIDVEYFLELTKKQKP